MIIPDIQYRELNANFKIPTLCLEVPLPDTKNSEWFNPVFGNETEGKIEIYKAENAREKKIWNIF